MSPDVSIISSADVQDVRAIRVSPASISPFEDDLMRLFGSDKLMSMFNALGVPENEQIEHKMLSSAIEKHSRRSRRTTMVSVRTS